MVDSTKLFSAPSPDFYHLQTTKNIQKTISGEVGIALVVNKDNFPAVEGITCFTIEIWEECMRLPHWHPNAAELGYVVSGAVEVIIWRSPGETAVFTVKAGMCWFIPKAALHSLNNIGKEPAVLVVSFSDERPKDIDLPVAFNGIPAPLRDPLTSPHAGLREWQGPIENPLFGRFTNKPVLNDLVLGSPYGFDLATVPPLFNQPDIGSVMWGIKDNWNILEELSVLRASLLPNVARDPIWYPDAGTLYVVTKGTGEFSIIAANQEPVSFTIDKFDYIFVPAGVLHTFWNVSSENFETVAFFTKADPLPEISLSVSTAFFPNNIRRDALTRYGAEHLAGDPLKHLPYSTVSPYLIKIG